MKTALVLTRCECQATLGAEVDENLVIVHGFARDPRRRRELPAPASVVTKQGARFDVGWYCPYCIRNTLRSFDTSALAYRDSAPAPAPSATGPVTPRVA